MKIVDKIRTSAATQFQKAAFHFAQDTSSPLRVLQYPLFAASAVLNGVDDFHRGRFTKDEQTALKNYIVHQASIVLNRGTENSDLKRLMSDGRSITDVILTDDVLGFGFELEDNKTRVLRGVKEIVTNALDDMIYNRGISKEDALNSVLNRKLSTQPKHAMGLVVLNGQRTPV